MNEQEIATKINAQAVNIGSLRSVASVVQTEGAALDIPMSDGGRTGIYLHELQIAPKTSNEMSYLFAKFEIDAFINGDGVNKPRGVLSYPIAYRQDWKSGTLECLDTNYKGQLTADDLIGLIYALSSGYRRNGYFVMNSNVAGGARRIKDADGRFVWQDEVAVGERPRLFGYPVLICEAMPDLEPGKTPIAFGDFKRGYVIAERPDVQIFRDNVYAKHQVFFTATKRIGGDVLDFEAIKLLRIAA